MSQLVHSVIVFVAAMEALTIVLWAIGRIPAVGRWINDHEPQLSSGLPWRVLLCMAISVGVIVYVVHIYVRPLVPGPKVAQWALMEAVCAFVLIALIVPIGGLIFHKRGASIGQVLAAVIGGQGLAWRIAYGMVGTLIMGRGQ